MDEPAGTIVVRNWSEFQHYRHRNPPWIKLHKILLDNPDWNTLPGDAAKALIGIWLIASERDGTIPDLRSLAFRLRVPLLETVGVCKTLCANGFLVDASNVLATCLQHASTEERRGEVELEKEKSQSTHRSADVWPAKPRKRDGRYVYPEEFEAAWTTYPKRGGDNPKVGAYKAFRARVKDGADLVDLVAASAHYRTVCQHEQRDGTPYVKQGSTFWGPEEPWREYIEPPTLSQLRTNGNRPPSDSEAAQWDAEAVKAKELKARWRQHEAAELKRLQAEAGN